jgi:hypothetical protein
MKKDVKRSKKSAVKVVTFLLCLSLLTGCSGNSSEKKGDNDTNVTATEAPADKDNGDTGKDDGNESDPSNDQKTDNKDNNESQNGTGDITKQPDEGTVKEGDKDTGNKSGDGDTASDIQVPEAVSFRKLEVEYKNKDTATAYVPGDCTAIVFSDDNVAVNGQDVEISKENGRQIVKITKKGDYLISGSCSNGQIIVEANKEKDVRLILNGITLSCADSAPIYEQQCDKMVITLADGSENVLSSTSEYIYNDVEKKQPDSIIFAKDDLVINGNGSLTVDTAYTEGIHSTDSVKLMSGNIAVNSGDNGVRGKEAVIIKDAKLDIKSRGDGIKTTYSDNTSLGYIIIEGGNVKVYSAKDGVQATGHIQITGGVLDITTDNGVAHADSEDSKSAKGIKSDHNIYINGASVTVNSTEDAINNNENLIIDGGSLTLTAMDDAIRTNGHVVINDGTVTMQNVKEGIDSYSVTVSGGNVTINAEDDGIKAQAGSNNSDEKVIFGDANPFSDASSAYIAVTGGSLNITSEGDYLDSDGNLYITGGKVTLTGVKAKEDGAVSYKGKAYVSAGSIEAEGAGDISAKISG